MRSAAPSRLRSFRDPGEFRAWLEAQLARGSAGASELFVRCYKVEAASSGLTYRQALDEALCTGWIDGVRHAHDPVSFSVRFSPRKPKSAWSAVNIRRFRELLAEGRVGPAGRRAYDARVKSAYSFESRPKALSPTLLKRFRARPRAWRFFEATPPWYRRTTIFYVMSAKHEDTRARRLEVLIAHSARQQGIPPLKLPGSRKASPRARRPATRRS